MIAEDVLKLADFGSCRGIYSKQPYTEYISTRWYRAPECLLTDGYYNYKMDIWGVGCVFFEIVSLFPLFPGTNELDQINKIHKILGTPAQELLEKFKRHSAHVDFNFPQTSGSGVSKLIPHVPPDAVRTLTPCFFNRTRHSPERCPSFPSAGGGDDEADRIRPRRQSLGAAGASLRLLPRVAPGREKGGCPSPSAGDRLLAALHALRYTAGNASCGAVAGTVIKCEGKGKESGGGGA